MHNPCLSQEVYSGRQEVLENVPQASLRGFPLGSCSFPCLPMSGRTSLGNVEEFLTPPHFQATDSPTRAVNTGLMYIGV